MVYYRNSNDSTWLQSARFTTMQNYVYLIFFITITTTIQISVL